MIPVNYASPTLAQGPAKAPYRVALNLTRLQQHYIRPRELRRCPGNRPYTKDLCDLMAGGRGFLTLPLEVRLLLLTHVSGQLLCSVISSRLQVLRAVRDPLLLFSPSQVDLMSSSS